MSPEEQATLRQLLTRQRVLSLAVIVEGTPCAGLLPFAVQPDLTAAFVHASALARHTAGLYDGARFSALIHQPDQPETDPLQLPRVALQGDVHRLEKGSPDYIAGRAIYTAKYPDSQPMFDLGDFNLYRLQFREGRFVAGFGRAFNLTAETLQRLAGQPGEARYDEECK